jgi:hypothetical protein
MHEPGAPAVPRSFGFWLRLAALGLVYSIVCEIVALQAAWSLWSAYPGLFSDLGTVLAGLVLAETVIAGLLLPFDLFLLWQFAGKRRRTRWLMIRRARIGLVVALVLVTAIVVIGLNMGPAKPFFFQVFDQVLGFYSVSFFGWIFWWAYFALSRRVPETFVVD